MDPTDPDPDSDPQHCFTIIHPVQSYVYSSFTIRIFINKGHFGVNDYLYYICIFQLCPGYVKPDIVFFGENLPTKFFEEAEISCLFADMLICAGTSLEVYPFAG
jgi:hypothetical protein